MLALWPAVSNGSHGAINLPFSFPDGGLDHYNSDRLYQAADRLVTWYAVHLARRLEKTGTAGFR
jgi:hypothetical protein